MNVDAAKLLREALKLPPSDRGALACQILDSLDEGVDEGAEAAWDREIAKRVAEIDNGQVKLVPWSEVRRRLIEIRR